MIRNCRDCIKLMIGVQIRRCQAHVRVMTAVLKAVLEEFHNKATLSTPNNSQQLYFTPSDRKDEVALHWSKLEAARILNLLSD
jgi:hypothetical protein